MKRPGYREAVEWIALNDDVSCWIDDNIITVTGAMVRDLYDVDETKLLCDIKKVIEKSRKYDAKTLI